jgi:hypothetical protein
VDISDPIEDIWSVPKKKMYLTLLKTAFDLVLVLITLKFDLGLGTSVPQG